MDQLGTVVSLVNRIEGERVGLGEPGTTLGNARVEGVARDRIHPVGLQLIVGLVLKHGGQGVLAEVLQPAVVFFREIVFGEADRLRGLPLPYPALGETTAADERTTEIGVRGPVQQHRINVDAEVTAAGGAHVDHVVGLPGLFLVGELEAHPVIQPGLFRPDAVDFEVLRLPFGCARQTIFPGIEDAEIGQLRIVVIGEGRVGDARTRPLNICRVTLINTPETQELPHIHVTRDRQRGGRSARGSRDQSCLDNGITVGARGRAVGIIEDDDRLTVCRP